MKAGQVRIVAGSAGGLWIKLPPNFRSRPTQNKIKQAIFSSLGELIMDARVLDLYAGSGSLGIEALSRGAAVCAFVDKDKFCAQAIRQNLEYCRLQGEVVTQSAESFVEKRGVESFDLIFLDPPYLKEKNDLSRQSFTKSLASRVRQNTWIVWEHHALNSWGEHEKLELIKHAKYGDTAVLFLRAR